MFGFSGIALASGGFLAVLAIDVTAAVLGAAIGCVVPKNRIDVSALLTISENEPDH
jgi:hypothetical protein